MSIQEASLLAGTFREVRQAMPPQSWLAEDGEAPTRDCRWLAEAVVLELFDETAMLPWRVAASRVGGIMLAYREPGSPVELELEIDNELDVVGVIATRQEVLDSCELGGPDEWRDFARKFRTAAATRTS